MPSARASAGLGFAEVTLFPRLNLFQDRSVKLGAGFWDDSLGGADNDSRSVGWDMELKRIVIGAAIVAACALGGLWLFQQIPVTRGALQQACLEAHDRSLVAAYLSLPEGMTGEEYREMVCTSCDCIAREALRQLPPEDLAAFVRKPMTPDIYARITAITPHLARMCTKRN